MYIHHTLSFMNKKEQYIVNNKHVEHTICTEKGGDDTNDKKRKTRNSVSYIKYMLYN